MIVCSCRRVSDSKIRQTIEAGATTLEQVGAACGAGTGCGACHESICEMLEEQRQDCGPRRLPVLSPYLTARQSAA